MTSTIRSLAWALPCALAITACDLDGDRRDGDDEGLDRGAARPGSPGDDDVAEDDDAEDEEAGAGEGDADDVDAPWSVAPGADARPLVPGGGELPGGDLEPPVDLTLESGIAGPIGQTNGVVLPCTGTTATGRAVICVRQAGGVAAGPGTAASPYGTIGAAVLAAKRDDVIQVAGTAGVWTTYLENVTFGGAVDAGGGKALTLLGGFLPDFSARNPTSYRTVIDGSNTLPALRIFISSGDVVIDGFTLMRGRGLADPTGSAGGGLYAQNFGGGTITLSHLIVRNNTTSQLGSEHFGGGVFAENRGTGALRFEDNTVQDNVAGKGGGMAVFGDRVTLLRNAIMNNSARHDHGGGVYLSATATVTSNIVSGNAVDFGYGYGGGILFVGGTSTMNGNIVTNNRAPTYGSGVMWDDGATGTMRNDFVYANRCPNSGSAIYVDGLNVGTPSRVTIENATIANHNCVSTTNAAAVYVDQGSIVTLRNTIFHAVGTQFATNLGGTYSATYSLTTAPGVGNRSADPLFADMAASDFHVRSPAGRWSGSAWAHDATTSPAIDGGDPATAIGAETIPHGGRVEIGAYGGTAEASKSRGSETCAAPAYGLAQGQSIQLVGTTVGNLDDLDTCFRDDPAWDGGDVVYQIALDAPGGTLTVELDEASAALDASLIVREGTCATDDVEWCSSLFGDREMLQLQPTTSTVFVMVDGKSATSGTYAIDVTYGAADCGDGVVNTGESCDPGSEEVGCDGDCAFEAPDPATDTCSWPAEALDVPAGGATFSSAAFSLTTYGYGDQSIGSCAMEVGGVEQVTWLNPLRTGTMRVSVGLDWATLTSDVGVWNAQAWDVQLYARAGCDAATELDCADDTMVGETIEIPVTLNTPVAVFVDGYDGGTYSQGPYDLRVDWVD